jgi:hypothetical protein
MDLYSEAIETEDRQRVVVDSTFSRADNSATRRGAVENGDNRLSSTHSAKASFPDHRSAALALLTEGSRLTRKAGSFLGQLAVDGSPLTNKQSAWLETLLQRAGLPPLTAEACPTPRASASPYVTGGNVLRAKEHG